MTGIRRSPGNSMSGLRLLTLVLGLIAIAITLITLWIPKTFGNGVHLEQILWHVMESNIEGIDPLYIKRGIKFSLFMLFLAFLWAVIVYPRFFLARLKKFNSIEKILNRSIFENKKWCLYLFVASLIYFIAICVVMDNKFQVSVYLKVVSKRKAEIEKHGDSLQKNYIIPLNKDIFFEKKKNLVIVLVESMESSFNDPILEQKLMPTMEILQASSQHVDKYINVIGTNWTIASLTGWFFGLPLKLPNGIDRNRYTSKKGFLPSALSIFDILRENGYELAAVLGSDARFSGQNILFSGHGGFSIQDREYFKGQGWSLAEFGGTPWGFNDAFVLARALEEYKKLLSSGKPFVLLVQTIDTHRPQGFCPLERRRYNDIRDAFVELDRNLAAFSRQIWNDDTILIILGDHLYMGEPEFLAPVEERHIFNLFHGDVPPIPAQKQGAHASALDMAPTLLQAAGARWGHDRFGLGVSLFSEQPTLLEQYGPQKFNEILTGWSPFYSGFYEKKAEDPIGSTPARR